MRSILQYPEVEPEVDFDQGPGSRETSDHRAFSRILDTLFEYMLVRQLTGIGNSDIWLARMLRYRSEVHSEKRAGSEAIWLCDRAKLDTSHNCQHQYLGVHRSEGGPGLAHRSSSFLRISTTSSGITSIFFRLRSTVTPGFRLAPTAPASAT